MVKYLLLFFLTALLGGNACGWGAQAQNPVGWTVKNKAELLTHVVSPGQRMEYIPFDNAHKGKLIFRFARTEEYFSAPRQRQLEQADSIFDIIFRYVLADSIRYFSEVTLLFLGAGDSAVHLKVPYALQRGYGTKVTPYTAEERFELLSSLIPLPHLKIENPSQPYRYRFMGFSFPSENAGVKLDELAMGNYAIYLAAIMYDFVLKRDNKIVSRLLIQYNTPDKYADLDAAPQYRNEYQIAADFFKYIKERNSAIIFKD